MEPQEKETPHHSRSMSKWSPILECACFESVPSTGSSEKGTACHKMLEASLKSWNQFGKLPVIAEDMDMYEAGAIRAAQRIVDDAVTRGVKHVHSEEFVELANGVRGVVDAYFIESNGTIHVYDFKTFWNAGRDNAPQLAGYALAIAQKYGLDDSNGFKYNACWYVLYGDTKERRMGSFSLDELHTYFDAAMAAFDAREAGTAEPRQCNWCNLCKHCATCKACTAVIVKTQSTAEKSNDWEALPIRKKAQLLVLAEFASQWADRVKEHAKADLLAGIEINDEDMGICYKLQTVRGRQTPDMPKACKMLQDHGVERNDLASKFKLATSDIKALLAGVGIKGKDATALIEGVCERGADTVKMVKA